MSAADLREAADRPSTESCVFLSASVRRSTLACSLSVDRRLPTRPTARPSIFTRKTGILSFALSDAARTSARSSMALLVVDGVAVVALAFPLPRLAAAPPGVPPMFCSDAELCERRDLFVEGGGTSSEADPGRAAPSVSPCTSGAVPDVSTGVAPCCVVPSRPLRLDLLADERIHRRAARCGSHRRSHRRPTWRQVANRRHVQVAEQGQ